MAVFVNKEKCDGCGLCECVCPVGCIEFENCKAIISDECIECGACVSECPMEAISFLIV